MTTKYYLVAVSICDLECGSFMLGTPARVKARQMTAIL